MTLSKKKKGKRKELTSLSQGRPPNLKTPTHSLSSKATRTIIRGHHTLQKQLAKAVSDSDIVEAARLQALLDDSGGLRSYQSAASQVNRARGAETPPSN
jgi:25S rRNA (adenine2142-N1)-methyltransferase